MKKTIISLFLSLLLLGTLFTASADNITISYGDTIPDYPCVYADQTGLWIDAMGEPVDTVQYMGGFMQADALQSGDVQVACGISDLELIHSASQGADLKVLSILVRAPGAVGIFSSDETLTTPESLWGKTVAGGFEISPYSFLSTEYQLLVAYLASGGLTTDDINFVSMFDNDARNAVKEGTVDVAVLGGIHEYFARSDEGLHLVTDGTGLISGIEVVATTQEFYNSHPNIAEQMKRAQHMVLEADSVYEAVAGELNRDAATIEGYTASYDYSPEITEKDVAALQQISNYMYGEGMISAPVDVTRLLLDAGGVEGVSVPAVASERNADYDAWIRLMEDVWQNSNYGDAYDLIEEYADTKYAPLQALIGECYWQGYGVDMDDYIAFDYFTRAADQGDVNGLYGVAASINGGYGTTQDQVEGSRLMLEAGELALEAAETEENELARGRLLYVYGWHKMLTNESAERTRDAFEALKQGADCGYPQAEGWTGLVYKHLVVDYNGNRLKYYPEASYELGEKYLKAAVSHGDIDAGQYIGWPVG